MYSRDPNSEHSNTGNIQNLDILVSGIPMPLPFEKPYITVLVYFCYFCLDFKQTILKPDHFDALFYSFGQNGGHLSQPFECNSTTGHISTIWIPDMSVIWIPTVYFKVKLTFKYSFNSEVERKSIQSRKIANFQDIKCWLSFWKDSKESSLKK